MIFIRSRLFRFILFAIQVLLLVIAAGIAGAAKNDPMQMLGLAWWQMVTGFTQPACALILTCLYWNTEPFPALLKYYWIAALVAFVLAISTPLFEGTCMGEVMFFLFPWCAATYFMIVTWLLAFDKNYAL